MNKKKVIIIIIVISFIILSISGILLFDYINNKEDTNKSNTNISNVESLQKLGYSKESIEQMEKLDILDKVLKNEYSKTLDVALSSNKFKSEYLDLYLNVEYLDKEDFIDKINALNDKGYTIEEINFILSKINYEDITYILESNYLENIKDYLNIENMDIQKLKRYIDYYNNNSSKDLRSVINYVNMDMDKTPYVDYKTVEDPNNILVLVNKYNKLADDYKPDDLERINTNYSVRNLYLRKDAKEAFEALCRDASSLGLSIRAISSYRTFDYQKGLYDNYVSVNGVEEADTYSARPGFSEHETGLATDVMGSNGNYTRFAETNEYTWVVNNAHNYGFVIRYPENKENITKYKFESWHLRYVGKDAATYMYENNLCLEEYLASNLK